LEQDLTDLIAFGATENGHKFSILGSTHDDLDGTLLQSSWTGWHLTGVTELDSAALLPEGILSRKFKFAGKLDLPFGTYSATLNQEWFALIRVVDLETITIQISPAVFTSMFHRIAKKNLKKVPAPRLSQPIVKVKAVNSFTDQTISLSGWTSSQAGTGAHSSPRRSSAMSNQVDIEQLKEKNKQTLKKLLLLSLRHVGIEKSHSEFMSIWKHLYCGCLFALRKELTNGNIDQATMLAVIKNNINFLNVSR
jgi:hypothetical protein